MTTYKVLLVDDEEEVRNAIEQRINWEELGFEVIGKAQNGVASVMEKRKQSATPPACWAAISSMISFSFSESRGMIE